MHRKACSGLAVARVSGSASASARRGLSGSASAASAGVRVSGSAPACAGGSSSATPGSASASGMTDAYCFAVPAALQQHLRTWGPSLKQVVINARDKWLKEIRAGVKLSGSPGRLGEQHLRLGTDCSGAEAPVWAWKAMQMPFKHVFSCDISKEVREFICAVAPPQGQVFEDMLKRDLSVVPDLDVYVCGFPCTPYSSLRRHQTRFMREPAAKPFFAVLKLLKVKRPALFVLENVLGIKACMGRIKSDLRALKEYFVFIVEVDSKKLGEPVSRPRYYMIGLRGDAALCQDVRVMGMFIQSCVESASKDVSRTATSLMLPNSCPEVQHVLRRRQARAQAARAKMWASGRPSSRQPKWKGKHKALGVAGVSGSQGVPPTIAQMHFSAARPAELWQTICKRHGSHNLIADVSQSVDRCTPRVNGCFPTITPRGIVCVGQLGRAMLGAEKLLAHLFPVHQMRIPRTISDTQLGLMGGNTMHLMSVGLAMLMGVSLLKSPFPRAPAQVTEIKGERVVSVGQRAVSLRLRGQKRPANVGLAGSVVKRGRV